MRTLIVVTLLTLVGCATSPNINPKAYCHNTELVANGMPTCYLDYEAYDTARIEREKLQNRQRWTAFWCDMVSTAVGAATGGGSELFGWSSLAVKVPIAVWANKKVNEADENSDHQPRQILSAVEYGACIWNIAG